MTYRLAFIGAGNMAEAIVRAALDRGVLKASEVIASDPSEQRRAAFAELGIAVTDDNGQAIRESRKSCWRSSHRRCRSSAMNCAPI